MGCSLIVGNIGIYKYIQAAADYLFSTGLDDNQGWASVPDQIAYIDFLNLASVNIFLEHVIELEGFSDFNEALKMTRFPHLPWWTQSYWLPAPFEKPKVPLIDERGFPVFLGSSYSLLKHLKEIKNLSGAGLGNVPDGYEEMKRDPKSFYLSDFSLEDENSILQWLWKALYDGATISIKESAPLIGIE
ncbi:MAG: hypothetical protein ACYC0Q_15130 [Eubacteriales bacterium]|nr:hypothetical protein [Bacillota bacterium]